MLYHKLKMIISFLTGAWALGIGLRFLVEFQNNMVYPLSSTFDMIFDWGMLFLLGTATCLINFYEGYVILKERENTIDFEKKEIGTLVA